MRPLLLAVLLALAPQEKEAAEPSAPAEVLIVLNKGAASADFVDTQTGAKVRTRATGVGPHEGAVSPDGRFCVVANYGQEEPGHTLEVFDLASGEALERIDLGEFTRPHGLAFAGELLLVTCEGKESLVGVDLNERKVVNSVVTGQRVSHMVAANPQATRAFVANIGSGTMTAVDLKTWSVIRSVSTGAGAEGIDVSPDGRQVWVTNRSADTVTVLDAETLEVQAQVPCEGFPIRVKLTPDGRRALVSCPNRNELCVIDARKLAVEVRIPLTFEKVEGGDEGLFGDRFGASAVPIGILVPPDGKSAYVACAAANLIAVVDLEKNAVTRAFEVGREPDGLAWYRRGD